MLWEVIGRFVVKNALFLATPSQTALALAKLWHEGALQHHAWVSAQEFLLGFTLAVALGIPIGLVTASWRRSAAMLNPWISGLYATPIIALDSRGLVKVNPLATWSERDVEGYIADHNIPVNPLLRQGYTSIGCWPCTKPVADGEHPRAGRWAGQDKTECGLHD